MLVYQAARKYDLYGLQTYAKKYIEMFDESMSIFDRMEAAREIYSKLPKDETWLASYIDKQLQIAFSLDTNIFQREEFYDGVGRDPVFDKAVMRTVVNIYSEVLSKQVSETAPEGDVAEDCAVEDGSVEDGAAEDGNAEDECDAADDGAVEECVAAEDGAAEDGAAEDGVTEECGAAEDDAADEGVVEEAINLGVPSQPSDTALRFGWDHWASNSKLGAPFSGYSQLKYEKDTNSLYPENKAEELGGFSAAHEGTKSKKKKEKKKKKGSKGKNMEKREREGGRTGRAIAGATGVKWCWPGVNGSDNVVATLRQL
ncbi:hypothetical protein LV160_008803 [Aspergillus fumigatus]|nr:hypothetical protein LV160_008803 [Aspergillus fumigatus]